MRLTPAQIDTIQSTVHAVLGEGVRIVMQFGSCAKGTARPDSDLDLAVDAGRVMTADQRLALTAELAALTGRPVDLIDLRTVGEPLLGQILQYGQRISGTDQAQAQYLTKHLIDVADFVPLQQRILQERRQAWIGQ
jgi:predicted nucleotidyltransferase